MPNFLFDRDDYPALTYSDVYVRPFNGIEQKVWDSANANEKKVYQDLRSAADAADQSQSSALDTERLFMDYIIELASKYKLDDPLSRDKIDFEPLDSLGNHTPIVSANMNRITGKRMAENMARMGSAAAIPQDKTDEEMQRIAEYLQTRTEYPTPITVTEQTTVKKLFELLGKRSIDIAVVIDDDGKFVGIVNGNDIPSGEDKDRPIRQYILRNDVITGESGIKPIDALRIMDHERIDLYPILNTDETVAGAYTKKEAAYAHRYTPFEGVNGGLAFLPTIGALNNDPIERLRLLIGLGARGVILDTANLDQGINAYRNIRDAKKLIEKEAEHSVTLIAGNVVTRDAVRRALSAGADIVKVGIGPGAMCSTRLKTAVGCPQFTAVTDCAEKAKEYGKHVWADGGIAYPRDVALALTSASQAMVGTILTPTPESSTELLKDDEGRAYAENTGMAARESSELRSAHTSSKNESDNALIRKVLGHRSEGERSRVYQQEHMESAPDIIHELMDGATSAMSYSDALNMEQFQKNVEIGIQMPSGYVEGLPK
jgi:IMP dehydrogenase